MTQYDYSLTAAEEDAKTAAGNKAKLHFKQRREASYEEMRSHAATVAKSLVEDVRPSVMQVSDHVPGVVKIYLDAYRGTLDFLKSQLTLFGAAHA